LTGKKGTAKIYLRNNTIDELRNKHGQFKELIGFGYDELSESEALYLLRAKSIERIRNQLTKTVLKRNRGGNE